MPHNRAVTCTGHMQYRCVCTHVWSPVTHTGLPSPFIPSSLLIFPSVRSHPYFAFSARIPLPAVGSDSAGKKKGVTSYFLLRYTFQKEGPIIVARAWTPAG